MQALRISMSPVQSLPEVVLNVRGCVRRKAPGTSEKWHAGGMQGPPQHLILLQGAALCKLLCMRSEGGGYP